MSARLGYFGRPVVKGQRLARQRGLARKINMLCEVLEGIVGVGGIRIHKTDNPLQWMIDGTEMTGGGGEPGLPVLFQGRVNEDASTSVYVGVAGQPVIVFPYSGNAYAIDQTGVVDGWLKLVGGYGDWYISVDISTSSPVAKLSPNNPDKPSPTAGRYGTIVGNWNGSSWLQKQYGTYHVPPEVDTLRRVGGVTPAESMMSISVSDNGKFPKAQVLSLHEFEQPAATKTLVTAEDAAAWGTARDNQQMLIKDVATSGGKTTKVLKYAKFYPLPAGDASNTSLKWDNTAQGWKKAAAMPEGYVERANSVIDIDVTVIDNAPVVRVKTGTILVKTGTESGWSALFSGIGFDTGAEQ